MENIATITTFLGWCGVINMGVLTYATVMILFFNSPVKKLQSKMLKVSPDRLDEMYFNFLGNYKLAIFVFNLAPYFALKIMA
ncbi:MAG: DUF6868 family protein [Spongiibacteraceae bacterium]